MDATMDPGALVEAFPLAPSLAGKGSGRARNPRTQRQSFGFLRR
jgi:hypothetical protein